MAKNIEVELRGLLSKSKYDYLVGFFEKSGKFREFKERAVIDYSTFRPGEEITNRTRDIRLRVTNRIPEIIVKIGKFGGMEQRREISVKTNIGDFDKLVCIFGIIGLTKGMLCFRKSRVYDYKGIEFALVEVPNHSYYFEAEKMAHNTSDFTIVEQEIRGVCGELGLTVVDKEGFFQYIEKLNKESNSVFEFSEYKTGYFKEKFGV